MPPKFHELWAKGNPKRLANPPVQSLNLPPHTTSDNRARHDYLPSWPILCFLIAAKCRCCGFLPRSRFQSGLFTLAISFAARAEKRSPTRCHFEFSGFRPGVRGRAGRSGNRFAILGTRAFRRGGNPSRGFFEASAVG